MKLSIYWKIQTLTSFINTYLKKKSNLSIVSNEIEYTINRFDRTEYLLGYIFEWIYKCDKFKCKIEKTNFKFTFETLSHY